MSAGAREWICCQIGNREHYALPRALHRAGVLRQLITDAWLRPGAIEAAAPRRLRGRYHPDLNDAPVWAPTPRMIAAEMRRRVGGVHGWDAIIERNDWFQQRVIERLEGSIPTADDGPSTVLFAYSYAARRIFEYAKSRRWTTVLGQIDPGQPEERLVAALQQRHAGLAPDWQPAPAAYWQQWREERQHADRIVVNSSWSRAAMIEEGVRPEALRIVPLAFEAPAAAPTRALPDQFSEARPLRVLFLGQVNLRKGIAELLDAVELLQHRPVQFTIVGEVQLRVPERFTRHPRITWVGSVPPADAASYYSASDVFVFPTHSDGFGITQLEAQAHALPVIASRFCGEVVVDGKNGLLLAEVSAQAIAEAIERLLSAPNLLAAMTRGSCVDARFSVNAAGDALARSIDAA